MIVLMAAVEPLQLFLALKLKVQAPRVVGLDLWFGSACGTNQATLLGDLVLDLSNGVHKQCLDGHRFPLIASHCRRAAWSPPSSARRSSACSRA